MATALEPNPLDLYSKASDRIDQKWWTSVQINTMTIGWILLIYAALLKIGGSPSIPVLLKGVFTLLHLPAYVMSCMNLLSEYRLLDNLRKELSRATDIRHPKCTGLIASVTNSSALKTSAAGFFVVLVHIWYAVLIYSIIWAPRLYLP